MANLSSLPNASVALIVVTYKSRNYLRRLRQSIEAQTFRDFRLVVWDNASPPDERPTQSELPDNSILVQSDTNLGFASANNNAAKLLDSEFVVLLNPDAFPEPDWLENLVHAATNQPDVGSFGSTQVMADQTDLYDGLGDCYHAFGLPWRGGYGWPRTAAPESVDTFSACAAAALYRRSVWNTLGGFDERYFAYCEDVDIGFRIRLLGWRTVQVARAVVHHVGGGSSGKRSDFAVFYGTRNRSWTFVKCMPAALFWPLLPAHLAVVFVFLILSPFRGTGAATWRGVAAALQGIEPILQARRVIQSNRRVKLADLAAAMTWNPARVLKRAPPFSRLKP